MAYISGTWWLLCDQCQRKVRSDKVAKRWDGKIVHADPNEGCWETRHPQEFIKPIRDNFPLPFVRPDNEGIEADETVNCSNHYVVEIPYLIEADAFVYKGHTLTPFGQVIVVDPAVVTVYCSWTIE